MFQAAAIRAKVQFHDPGYRRCGCILCRADTNLITSTRADIRRVREAYRFADEAHLGQFRASGEAYITHPIAVAGLC